MSTTKKLILDIETVGEDFDALDETAQESLTRWIQKESSSEEDYEVALKTLEARAALDGKIKEFEELRPRFNEILRRIGRRKRV